MLRFSNLYRLGSDEELELSVDNWRAVILFIVDSAGHGGGKEKAADEPETKKKRKKEKKRSKEKRKKSKVSEELEEKKHKKRKKEKHKDKTWRLWVVWKWDVFWKRYPANGDILKPIAKWR